MKRRDFLAGSLTVGSVFLLSAPGNPLDSVSAQSGQFVHSVYFWMRDDLSDEERETFEQGLVMLKGLESVRAGYIGTPPPGERDIVDDSFDYALVLVFDDAAGHAAYQEHPDHEVFRQETEGFWRDIKIYDILTQAD